jgi:hypothetical protein
MVDAAAYASHPVAVNARGPCVASPSAAPAVPGVAVEPAAVPALEKMNRPRLDDGGGEPALAPPVHELRGDAVVVVRAGDVVVDVDAGVAPLGELVAARGQYAKWSRGRG